MKALAIFILYVSGIALVLCGGMITLFLLWMILGTETMTHLIGEKQLMSISIFGLGGILFLEIVIRIAAYIYYRKQPPSSPNH